METIAFICVITLLFRGVVTDESVSLMEGDNVTLHTNTTDVKREDVIFWMFGDKQDVIARINRPANNSLRIEDDVPDGRFRGKLKMNNQTGDLTITNVTTNHTGLYQLEINRETLLKKRFHVCVSVDKVKTVTVGHSVVLHNNVTKKPGDEKMVWRIRHNNFHVAEIIRNGKEINYEVYDERFRGRLQVNDQTGNLTITNTTTDDSGSYEVDITVSNYTIHRSFSVNVTENFDQQKDHQEQDQPPGLSSDAIAGICVGVLFVVVVAAAGFLIHRKFCKTPGNRNNRTSNTRTNEETEEMAEMNKPLRNGDPSGSDVP